MNIFEGLIKPTLTPTLNIDMSEKTVTNHYNIEKIDINLGNAFTWLLALLLAFFIGMQVPSCSSAAVCGLPSPKPPLNSKRLWEEPPSLFRA